MPTLTATLHLTTPPLYAYNEIGGRNPITKLASGFPGAHGAGPSSLPFIQYRGRHPDITKLFKRNLVFDGDAALDAARL